MFHSLGTSERCIGLNYDAMLSADGADVFSRVKRMDLDLVHGWTNARIRCHQLFNLWFKISLLLVIRTPFWAIRSAITRPKRASGVKGKLVIMERDTINSHGQLHSC